MPRAKLATEARRTRGRHLPATARATPPSAWAASCVRACPCARFPPPSPVGTGGAW